MLWVTMKNGEVRRYNDAGAYEINGGMYRIGSSLLSLSRKESIATIRASDVAILEFSQPCEVTFRADVVESAIDVLLRRAQGIRGNSVAGDKLASLTRLLRKFNPQRRTWKS